MQRLGGRAIYLGPQEIGPGEREPVRDIARVLGRMVHGIAARTYAHDTVPRVRGVGRGARDQRAE